MLCFLDNSACNIRTENMIPGFLQAKLCQIQGPQRNSPTVFKDYNKQITSEYDQKMPQLYAIPIGPVKQNF